MNGAWVLLAAGLFASGCDNPASRPPDVDGFQRLAAQGFSVSVPPGWQRKDLPGIDSYVGEISGDGITLHFDFGWYSDPLSPQNYPGHSRTSETIDGERATIVVPSAVGNGITGVHFPDLGQKTKLTISGRDLTASQQSTVLQIFRSIRFTN
jgi:hypothetical protein